MLRAMKLCNKLLYSKYEYCPLELKVFTYSSCLQTASVMNGKHLCDSHVSHAWNLKNENDYTLIHHKFTESQCPKVYYNLQV